MKRELSDFRLVTALIDNEIDEHGNYVTGEYELLMEFINSLTVEQMQNIYQKIDDLKIDLEKLILLRS